MICSPTCQETTSNLNARYYCVILKPLVPQSSRTTETFDVVVVGAGAGGGTMSRVMAAKGAKVALLEAGPKLVPEEEFKEHHWDYDYDHRGAGPGGAEYFSKGKPFGFMRTTSGGWELPDEPYTVGKGSEFVWFRSRVVGGRTNHYGRMSFRLSEWDLKAHDRDGVGPNWPISYADIAPYYDKAEKFIGVTGTREAIPSAPDGIFHDPPQPKAHELFVRSIGKKVGIPFIANRRAIITREHNQRAACHYCGQCGRGCLTASAYSASQVDVFPALKTGNLTLLTDAMAREVLTDASGKATGVLYIDRKTRQPKRVLGKTVVLAASTCESARILLNSKSKAFPNGLANGSGMVGRNLMDTVGLSVSGHVPALEGMPVYNTDGFGGSHLYAPWWGYNDHAKLGFPRGYHVEFGGGFGMPGVGSGHGAARRAGYGTKIKDLMRQQYGSRVGFAGRGEMIPNRFSYCELDPEVVDDWGIPVLRFHFKFSDYEWKQARHMERTFEDIIGALGGRVTNVGNRFEKSGISMGGSIIHEVGTACMGNDPRSSVLNPFCQTHEVKNLFVTDGASFVTNPDKNPTLTINALSWRAADYLAEEMRKGDV
jgi:choline dehydrogenase-like flavoprotein